MVPLSSPYIQKPSHSSPSVEKEIPLVVDLDGSLIKTELPVEAFLLVLLNHPWEMGKILLRKIKIRKESYVKIELDKWASIPWDHIPVSENFLHYLKKEKAKGRKLVLCTGSSWLCAQQAQKKFGLFDEVYSSVLGQNLIGKKKALFLLKKYGNKKFDYAGNSLVDLYIAPYTRRFILVNPSFWTLFLCRNRPVYKKFSAKKIPLMSLLKTLGLSFWVWNLLVFLIPAFKLAREWILGKTSVFSFSQEATRYLSIFYFLHFCFLALVLHTFFKMVFAVQNRAKKNMCSDNVFIGGGLRLSKGLLFCGIGLILAFASLFFLIQFHKISLLFSAVYCAFLWVFIKSKGADPI